MTGRRDVVFAGCLRGLAIAAAYVGAAAAAPSASARNVALGMQYSLDPPASYGLTKSDTDRVKLTDGKFATRHFWTSRDETVGWEQSGVIRVDLDLASVRSLSRVCVNSARGEQAGVSFPERVDAFVSVDGRNYAYAGDVMRGQSHADGAYLVAKYCSRSALLPARYVTLMVKPRGDYTFLDEIEAFDQGEPARPAAYPIAVGDLANFAEALFANVYRAKALARLGARLRDVAQANRFDDIAADVRTVTDRAAERLDDAAVARDAADLAQALENDLLTLNRQIVARRFPERLVVWHKDPWSTFTPLDSPEPDARLSASLRVDVARDGVASDAVVLTNSRNARRYDVRLADVDRQAAPQVVLREVVPVLVADGTIRGDALVPLTGSSMTIREGESKQLWLSIDARRVAPGEYPLRIVMMDDSGELAATIDILCKVWPVSIGNPQHLKVNAWSYLNWRPIRNIPEQAVADLREHHTNVFVLPDADAPWPRFGKQGEEDWTADYTQFDRYVRLHGTAGKLLFYLELNSENRRTFGGRYPFMSERWQALFKTWIRNWSQRALAQGLPYEAFAFYPVDEPKNAEEARYLIETARLIKSVDPALPVYTTLGALQGLDLVRAVEVVDIFQVPEKDLSSVTTSLLKQFGKTIWSYAGGGKQAHPFASYRAQAWRAFAQGATGIGIWAYADTGERGSAWNDIDGRRPDPAVIYESDNGIVSSKRWEAWREGVEDYEILWRARVKLSGQRSVAFERDLAAAPTASYAEFQRIRQRMLAIAAQ